MSLYELSTATIVLFELALDSLLIPALKASTDDPLQAEVFRRIDIDESRHLAMDYWLLDKKGAACAGRTVDDLFRERHGRDRTLVERAVARLRLARALLTFVVGFAATDLAMPSIREATLRPETMGKYLRRVRAVPKKAPHALDVPTFRMGLRGQRMLLDALSRLSGRGRFDPREFAA
ncbi:MAG: hypothetical protein D6689_16000 [Deltaproteobacteria bacterium]|nr:MAG: hypothetical protein D6689_16000 [Deltaproteobacteria bacterium]